MSHDDLELTPAQVAGLDQEYCAVRVAVDTAVKSVCDSLVEYDNDAPALWLALIRQMNDSDHLKMVCLLAESLIRLSRLP